NLTRREFLKFLKRLLAVTGLAALTAPIVAYFYPPKLEEEPSEPVYVGKQEEIPLNGSKTVGFGRYPALVVNTPQGFRAYSAVCTHFACLVKWDEERKAFLCPCHDAAFDPVDGHVLHGPTSVPLKSYAVTITNGEIYIGGNQE
ncbi:MAG: Rieske (2Fe-2S) protein, partial [Anaerolineales bacterium]|nr:Rieske (2Fe-2S) protein [Anaerolineales bacterium]MDW8446709.1 Rieske (2Fe-2S) protein [Anaerolineales bacterium]